MSLLLHNPDETYLRTLLQVKIKEDGSNNVWHLCCFYQPPYTQLSSIHMALLWNLSVAVDYCNNLQIFSKAQDVLSCQSFFICVYYYPLHHCCNYSCIEDTGCHYIASDSDQKASTISYSREQSNNIPYNDRQPFWFFPLPLVSPWNDPSPLLELYIPFPDIRFVAMFIYFLLL